MNINSAFVFIKPHANTPAVERLLLSNLEQRHIQVVAQGLMTAEDIDKKGTIDKHYFSIARYATIWKPQEIPITADSEKKFQEAFFPNETNNNQHGDSTSSSSSAWKRAIESKKLMNAMQALHEVFRGDTAALAQAWGAAKVTKLAPGFYAGHCEKEGIYIINGFFIAMRAKFTAPGKSVRWFIVQWNEIELPWAEFRGAVIGATNPDKAAIESVRAQILQKWEELRLPAKPDGSDNGIHASAGPIEGLNERIIWLNGQVAADRFGRTLLDAGIDAQLITEFLANPSIQVNKENVPAFDVLEDKDSSYVVQFMVNYQLANGTTLDRRNKNKNANDGDSSLSSSATSNAARNYGFLYIKPTQNVADVQNLVFTKLKNSGIRIKSTADVSGKIIAENKIVEKQFASIFNFATAKTASEYGFDDNQKTLFRSTFGRDFDEAKDLALICNAQEAAERMNLFKNAKAADIMLAKWNSAIKQTFAPGLTIGYFSEEDLYVANGFYAAMEKQYVNPSASVRLYHLEWDEERLTWQEFLDVIVGRADPTRARPGSIRSILFNQWKSLGLQNPPDILENGVGASGSPIEALKDRMTWVPGTTPQNDVFGKIALVCGVPEQALVAWLENPTLTLGGKTGPVFSTVRGMDSSNVIRMIAGQKVTSVLTASERSNVNNNNINLRSTGTVSTGVAPEILSNSSNQDNSKSRALVAASTTNASSPPPPWFSPAAHTILTPRRRANIASNKASPLQQNAQNDHDQKPAIDHNTRAISLSSSSSASTPGVVKIRDGVDVAPPRAGYVALNSPRRHTKDAGSPQVSDRQRKLEKFRRTACTSNDLTEEKLHEYFALFDVDGNGQVDRNEFKAEFRKFESFGLTPSPSEIDEIFDRYDFRRDGFLSFDEFALLMCHRTQM